MLEQVYQEMMTLGRCPHGLFLPASVSIHCQAQPNISSGPSTVADACHLLDCTMHVMTVCLLWFRSPQFPRMTLNPIGADFGSITVIAHGAPATFVQKLEVNGKPIDMAYSPFVDQQDILRPQGSTLEFWMTNEEPSYNSNS